MNLKELIEKYIIYWAAICLGTGIGLGFFIANERISLHKESYDKCEKELQKFKTKNIMTHKLADVTLTVSLLNLLNEEDAAIRLKTGESTNDFCSKFSKPDARADIISYLFSGSSTYREKAITKYGRCFRTIHSAYSLARTIKRNESQQTIVIYAKALISILLKTCEGELKFRGNIDRLVNYLSIRNVPSLVITEVKSLSKEYTRLRMEQRIEQNIYLE